MEKNLRDFPGGPVFGTPYLPCRGQWVQFLTGELRSHMLHGAAKKKKNLRKNTHTHTHTHTYITESFFCTLESKTLKINYTSAKNKI